MVLKTMTHPDPFLEKMDIVRAEAGHLVGVTGLAVAPLHDHGLTMKMVQRGIVLEIIESLGQFLLRLVEFTTCDERLDGGHEEDACRIELTRLVEEILASSSTGQSFIDDSREVVQLRHEPHRGPWPSGTTCWLPRSRSSSIKIRPLRT